MQHTPADVRDTIGKVFRGSAYDRSGARTLGDAFVNLIQRAIGSVIRAFATQPTLGRIALAVGFSIIALIVIRALYVASLRARLTAARAAAGGRARGAGGDPWTAAHAAASAGRFTEAAHLLYAALLEALAQRERLRLHPSKTAGDYARELRSRSSSAASPFRTFVRAFEVIAYGHGECDAAQFDRLRTLAAPLVGATE